MDYLYSPLESVKRYAGSVSWGPMVTLSRSLILSVLRQIQLGQLSVTDLDGHVEICGQSTPAPGSPRTQLRVHKESFWVRMLLFADMGFAESYMLGEFSCTDLTAFFELFIRNRAHMSNGTTLTSYVSGTVSGLARRTNTLANAQLNISAHYDISNEMFASFLSDDMTYSCPIWRAKSDPKSASETLEHAQETKLRRFIDNARIQKTDHVLEIGTGWGSLAMLAVQLTGCRVTSITLSREQKELAEKRIAAAGLTDNIEVLLCDYRALPKPRTSLGYYDKVVSCEMLEAVGREFLTTYFECVDKLLKPEGGIAVFQCITIPEARYDAYQKSTDFIRRYIFPGGHLPNISQLVASLTQGSRNTLVVESIENIGPHYAKTLRRWREKFTSNFDARIKQALLDEHEGMTERDTDVFRRKWEYYFTYCEAGFRTCTLGDVIITCAREGSEVLAANVPL